MTILPSHLQEFKELYKTHYGADLSDQEALDKGMRLISLVEVVMKKIYENGEDKYRKI